MLKKKLVEIPALELGKTFVLATFVDGVPVIDTNMEN
jgi:hypothetical protein